MSDAPVITPGRWSVRSVLISVQDLERSISFYRNLLGLREVAREDEVAVLETEHRTFAMMLRQVRGQPHRYGQQALGTRALSFDVGSQKDLDEVAKRLKTAGAFASRRPLHDSEPLEVVAGRDPDGFPLLFVTYEADQPLAVDHYLHVALFMFGVDL